MNADMHTVYHSSTIHCNQQGQFVCIHVAHVHVSFVLDVQVHYDLLVAADGAASVVRAHLAKSMPAGYIRRIRHKVEYSTIGLRPPADQVPCHAFFQVHQFEVRQSL